MGDHTHHHASAASGKVHGAAGLQNQTGANDDHKLQDAAESGLRSIAQLPFAWMTRCVSTLIVST
jgi:hypothetical protein